MRTITRAVVGMVTLVAVAVPTPALAGSPSGLDSGNGGNQPKTVVIDGREFGPKDGLQVDTFQFEIEPGAGPVGLVFDDTSIGPGSIAPMATWGASYAISTEWWSLLGYDGKAKAAANVYLGKRIIQVCIWYTRDGEGVVGPKICSNATDPNYVWLPGPEVTESVWDSLNPFAPPTIFHISTVRIDPRII